MCSQAFRPKLSYKNCKQTRKPLSQGVLEAYKFFDNTQDKTISIEVSIFLYIFCVTAVLAHVFLSHFGRE